MTARRLGLKHMGLKEAALAATLAHGSNQHQKKVEAHIYASTLTRADAAAVAAREIMFDRLQWQLESLRASLDRCAAAHAVMAAEFACGY